VTGSTTTAPSVDPDARPTGPARLDIEELVVSFGGLKAVAGVSMAIEPGSIVGLIGSNGSGKTTLLDAVSGLVSPAGGKLLYDNEDLSDYIPEERARLGMVRSFQDCRLYPELSVEDTLLLCEDARRRINVLSTTLQMPWARRIEREKRVAVDHVIGSFGLARFRHHSTAHLSTGTRRVVDLASIVLANPRLLLLDEPTAGIAQREAEAFIPLLRRLHEVTDSTILLVEHDVPLVFELCSTVVVMQTGEMVAAGSPDEVKRDPRALAAYLGASDEAINVSGPVKPSAPVIPSSAPGSAPSGPVIAPSGPVDSSGPVES
jgi:ABC-type branched-subunit amino acid transport system ATPase component